MRQILIYFSILIMTSCAPTAFYQVYKANPESGLLTNDRIIFQDKNCKISYDLWDEGGDIGFYIYNSTESDMIIDLTKSFFVLNGVSFEYFQNRTFTKTNSSGSSVSTSSYSYLYARPTNVSGTAASGFSTSNEEKSNITIPSKTMVKISEFRVSKSRHINCDLPKYPTTKDIKTEKFDKTNSPFIFYNIITYSVKNETTRFENNFFVSELTNLPEASMFTKIYESACGNKLLTPVKEFKNASPDKFYVKYIREN